MTEPAVMEFMLVDKDPMPPVFTCKVTVIFHDLEEGTGLDAAEYMREALSGMMLGVYCMDYEDHICGLVAGSEDAARAETKAEFPDYVCGKCEKLYYPGEVDRTYAMDTGWRCSCGAPAGCLIGLKEATR